MVSKGFITEVKPQIALKVGDKIINALGMVYMVTVDYRMICIEAEHIQGQYDLSLFRAGMSLEELNKKAYSTYKMY